jgi:predicted Rossmann-fold nucleotide-binding protein
MASENRQKTKRILEVDDRAELQRWLSRPEGSVAVQGVDINGLENELAEVRLAGCLFLNCEMSDAFAGFLLSRRAVVIPTLNWFPFPAHRTCLYSPEELFAGFDPESGDYGNYEDCYDHLVYQHYLQSGSHLADIDVTFARSLHDHSMTDARDEFVAGRKMVAIMGGHDLLRSDLTYQQVAQLARKLTQAGFTLASGGGPGAMEATHLGAYFAGLSDQDFLDALQQLGQRRGIVSEAKEYKDRDWLQRAYRIREKYPLNSEQLQAAESLAIPTWFYGHEPPAPFATHIAKYFANSIREDGLLQIANYGIIFAPGNAGTVQEIFQDAAQNYYKTFGHVAPMILWGHNYWTQNRPAWDLLLALANTPGRESMREHVHLVDDPSDAMRLLSSFAPERT